MKQILLVVPCLLWCWAADAQGTSPVYARSANISAQPLSVSSRKTTSLIFSSAIKSVDRGSDDIIVQKAPGVENILKIKAAKQRFEETNLSVITADGQFYSFNVNFSSSPYGLTQLIRPGDIHLRDAGSSRAVFSQHLTNETRLKKLAAQASITRRNIAGVKDERYGMTASLTGLYVADDRFFCKLMIENNSNISYDIEAVSLYIRDRKKIKRTATQEITLQPLMVVGASDPIGGKSTRMLIVALPKQTITSDKRLLIEINEKNGGRDLSCALKSSVLLKAKPITVTNAVDNIPNVLSAGK